MKTMGLAKRLAANCSYSSNPVSSSILISRRAWAVRPSGSASRTHVPSRKSRWLALLLAPSKRTSPNPVIVVSQRSLGPDGLRGDAQAGRRFHLLGWRLAREMG